MIPVPTNPQAERVKYELRASGVKDQSHDPLRSGVHTRGYLPHVKRERAWYFVTFRLADSIPQSLVRQYQAERAEALRRLQAEKNASDTDQSQQLAEIEREYRRKTEKYLDEGRGECWLKRPEIAALMVQAFRFFENERYYLDAWVVMPNHVHVVVWPTPNQLLDDILQSWKRFTARQANLLLGRTGQPFWQRESYDHWIRNDEEHARCCRYVCHNPVKAGLCAAPEDWPWSSAAATKP